MTRLYGALLGIVAILVEIGSVYYALRDPTGSQMLAALLFHLCASILSLVAARLSGVKGGRDCDAVLMTALFVPLFGPALAWMMPVQDDAEALAARVMLEQVESRLEQGADYARPLYQGDFEADLARQVNSVSYYEVLETGDLEQKRDALRKLARLGEPRHLALLMRTLEDPEQELRLCAYLELDRVRQRHERTIAKRQKAVEAWKAWEQWLADVEQYGEQGAAAMPAMDEETARSDPEQLRTALARAHLDYAVSGCLDVTMRQFRLDCCLQVCAAALARDAWNDRVMVIEAQALCERGFPEEAELSLQRVSPEFRAHPALRSLLARICFERRDFAAAKKLGDEMLEDHMDPPPWLQALCAEHELATSCAARLPQNEPQSLRQEELADVLVS